MLIHLIFSLASEMIVETAKSFADLKTFVTSDIVQYNFIAVVALLGRINIRCKENEATASYNNCMNFLKELMSEKDVKARSELLDCFESEFYSLKMTCNLDEDPKFIELVHSVLFNECCKPEDIEEKRKNLKFFCEESEVKQEVESFFYPIKVVKENDEATCMTTKDFDLSNIINAIKNMASSGLYHPPNPQTDIYEKTFTDQSSELIIYDLSIGRNNQVVTPTPQFLGNNRSFVRSLSKDKDVDKNSKPTKEESLTKEVTPDSKEKSEITINSRAEEQINQVPPKVILEKPLYLGNKEVKQDNSLVLEEKEVTQNLGLKIKEEVLKVGLDFVKNQESKMITETEPIESFVITSNVAYNCAERKTKGYTAFICRTLCFIYIFIIVICLLCGFCS